MNKNEIKQLKNSPNINNVSNAVKENKIKKNEEKKLLYIAINKKITKNNSSNLIYDSIGEDTKSKNSKLSKNKKKEKGNKKKKNKDKLFKLLKSNEKLKIPTGKRRSCVTGAGLKLNLNNDNNNILKTLTPPKKKKFIRTDKNGVEINKNNKKKVHITFLDEISPDHKITEVINIQSFKQYNVIEEIPGEDILPKISKCCSIF